MFLLVSVRHVDANPAGHQHGVSIQISIYLGKTFLRISRMRNIPLTWVMARVFAYIPPFISQILDFIYWTVLIFILIYSACWHPTLTVTHILNNVTSYSFYLSWQGCLKAAPHWIILKLKVFITEVCCLYCLCVKAVFVLSARLC